MSNIKQIKPIQMWTSDGTKTADYLMLYNFHDYDFNDSASSVSFKLMALKPNVSETETGMAQYTSLYENSIVLPFDLVNQWGEDDSIIWDYVVNQLNVEIIDGE